MSAAFVSQKIAETKERGERIFAQESFLYRREISRLDRIASGGY